MSTDPTDTGTPLKCRHISKQGLQTTDIKVSGKAGNGTLVTKIRSPKLHPPSCYLCQWKYIQRQMASYSLF